MSEGKRNREKQCRRLARAAHNAALNAKRPPKAAKHRTSFSAKVGNGDSAVTIEFVFSGLPVPFDPAHPSRHLREKTVVAAYIAKATEGNTH